MSREYIGYQDDTYRKISSAALERFLDSLLSGPEELNEAISRGWDDGRGSHTVRMPVLPKVGDSGIGLNLIHSL